ncbi:MAG: tetratricopeptide repeat protein [Chitinophagaceae bacterium]
MIKFFLLPGCLLLTAFCFSQQNEQDSLLQALKNHPAEDTTRLTLLTDLAFSYYRNNPAEGIATADKAIVLAKKLSDLRRMASAFSHKGVNYHMLGEDSMALKMYEQAWRIHEQYGNRSGMGKVLHNMGLLYNGMADYYTALDYHGRALKIFEELHDSTRIPIAINSLGVNYMSLSDFPRAQEQYLRSLRIYEKTQDSANMALTFTNLGIIHNKMADYSQSLAYHNRALEIMKKSNNKSSIADIIGNIGVTYDDMRQYDKALQTFREALSISESVGYKKGIASNYNNMAITFNNIKDYGEALKCLQKTVPLYHQLGDKQNLSSSLSEIAKIYTQSPDHLLPALGINQSTRYPTAIRYLQQALQLAKETDNIETQQTSWEYLADCYEKQKDYAHALTAFKNAAHLNDSIVNDEKRTVMHRKEAEFEFEKKEALLKAEHDKKEALNIAAIHRQQIIRNAVLAVSVLVLIAGITIFIFYKRKRDAEQQKQEADLNAQVIDTEMKALRAQMNPHFIFNSLNSISDFLSKNDIPTANTYLVRFAKVMRMILENSEHKLVSIADDLKALELYIQLEAMRLQQSFTYSIHVEKEIDAENTLIPPLILQPFVENSIWHGISGKENGAIKIDIQKQNDMLVCSVEDNGIGLKSDKSNAPGKQSLGMKITQDRVDIINKTKTTNAFMSVADNGTGTKASITLPFELQF